MAFSRAVWNAAVELGLEMIGANTLILWEYLRCQGRAQEPLLARLASRSELIKVELFLFIRAHRARRFSSYKWFSSEAVLGLKNSRPRDWSVWRGWQITPRLGGRVERTRSAKQQNCKLRFGRAERV